MLNSSKFDLYIPMVDKDHVLHGKEIEFLSNVNNDSDNDSDDEDGNNKDENNDNHSIVYEDIIDDDIVDED